MSTFEEGTKVRVYTMAQSLGLESKELLVQMESLGFSAKSAQSSVSAEDANLIMKKLSSPKKETKKAEKTTSPKKEAKKEEPKTPKKAAKKAEPKVEVVEKEEATVAVETKKKKAPKKAPVATTEAKEESNSSIVSTLQFIEEYLKSLFVLLELEVSFAITESKEDSERNKGRSDHYRNLTIFADKNESLFPGVKDKEVLIQLAYLLGRIAKQQGNESIFFFVQKGLKDSESTTTQETSEPKQVESAPQETESKKESKVAQKEVEPQKEHQPREHKPREHKPRAEEEEENEFVEVAEKIAEKAIQLGKAVVLSNLNSKDRRKIHTVLADREDVQTLSDGEGVFRKLIIAPQTLKIRNHSSR